VLLLLLMMMLRMGVRVVVMLLLLLETMLTRRRLMQRRRLQWLRMLKVKVVLLLLLLLCRVLRRLRRRSRGRRKIRHRLLTLMPNRRLELSIALIPQQPPPSIDQPIIQLRHRQARMVRQLPLLVVGRVRMLSVREEPLLQVLRDVAWVVAPARTFRVGVEVLAACAGEVVGVRVALVRKAC